MASAGLREHLRVHFTRLAVGTSKSSPQCPLLRDSGSRDKCVYHHHHKKNATTSTKATKTQSLLLRQIHGMLAEEERGCVACTSCVGRQQLYNHIHPFILRGNTDIKIKG